MLYLAVFIACLYSCICAISHNIPHPTIIANQVIPQIKTISAKQTIQINLPYVDYEIGGAVYESPDQMLDQQLYSSSNYQPSTSCKFYPTELSLVIRGQVQINNALPKLDDVKRPDLIVEQSLISQEKMTAFLLLNQSDFSKQQDNNANTSNITPRSIVSYKFDANGIDTKPALNFTVASINLNESEGYDIAMMTTKQKWLIVTDQIKLVAVDTTNSSKFQQLIPNDKKSKEIMPNSQHATKNNLIKFQRCNKDPYRFHMLWEDKMLIFALSSDFTRYTFLLELLPSGNKPFVDVIVDDYDYYVLLEGGTLQIWRDTGKDYTSGTVKLESDRCEQINKVGQILHVVCTEAKMQYLAEFHYDKSKPVESSLTLNRYYTDLSDINAIFPFGKPSSKLFMVGDDELLFTFLGVNRYVLLDLNKKQAMHKYKAIGIEDIQTIDFLGDGVSSVAVGAGIDFLVMFEIVQKPPQVECTFERKDGIVRSSLLIVVNSSTCPSYPQKSTPTLTSICQTLIPLTFYIQSVEVSRSKGLMITLLVIAAVLVVILFVLGCLFKQRGIRNRAMQTLRRKLDKLLKEKVNKPLPIG